MKKSDNISEEKLLEGCRKNDRKYQEIFYKKYFDLLYPLCLSRIHDSQETMLVVNNTFLKAFKNIHQYNGTGSLESWLRRILFNSVMDYFRKNKKHNGHSDIMEKVGQVIPIASTAQSDLYYADLLEMINQLPVLSKEVFHLFAIEGYSHQDIADMLQIPEGTSKWHLHQARKILKAKLTKNGHSVKVLKVNS